MLTLVFAALLPLLPDQAVQPTPPAPPPLAARAFSELFVVPPSPAGRAPAQAAKERVRKKVVCGMTLLIVDGSGDPKMVIAPRGPEVDPGMPRVPKPMCGPERK